MSDMGAWVSGTSSPPFRYIPPDHEIKRIILLTLERWQDMTPTERGVFMEAIAFYVRPAFFITAEGAR